MVVRQIVAIAWALVLGLVGGWLMLAPWAVGFQSAGAWTDATKSAFGTGAFLVLLAVAALWIAVADVVSGLRELGVIRARPKPPARPKPARHDLERFGGDLALGALCLGLTLAPVCLVFAEQLMPDEVVPISDAYGYAGLGLLCAQAIFAARSKPLVDRWGRKTLFRWHRYLAYITGVLLLLHPALLIAVWPRIYLPLFNLSTAPWRGRFGVTSLVLFVVMVILATQIKRMNTKAWILLHRWLTVLVVATALVHIALVGHYATGWRLGAVVLLIGGMMLFGLRQARRSASSFLS